MAKILIVEDNQGTNKAICEYMKEAGHTLFSAFTGSEALKIFREKELDIIVLDIMLPEMSGIVVLHEIRKISNIPVIMLTPKELEILKVLIDNKGLVLSRNQTMLKTFPISILCCAAISALFSYFFSRGITTPILSLSKSANQMLKLEPDAKAIVR